MKQEQVDKVLESLIDEAEKEGKSSVRIVSGELNKKLPFKNEKDRNRCPMCCSAMRKIIKEEKDMIISETDSGQSSTFTVEYKLPRNEST